MKTKQKKPRTFKKMSFVATVDRVGRLAFGIHKGKPVSEIPKSYARWVIENCRIDAACRKAFYDVAGMALPDPETKRFAFENPDIIPDPTQLAPWEEDETETEGHQALDAELAAILGPALESVTAPF